MDLPRPPAGPGKPRPPPARATGPGSRARRRCRRGMCVYPSAPSTFLVPPPARFAAMLSAWGCAGNRQTCFHHWKARLASLKALLAAMRHGLHDPRMADTTLSLSDIAQGEPRWRAVWRNLFPFLVVGAIWEIVAHAGTFPPRLFPAIETIAAAFWRLTVAGILPQHAFDPPPPPAAGSGRG